MSRDEKKLPENFYNSLRTKSKQYFLRINIFVNRMDTFNIFIL